MSVQFVFGVSGSGKSEEIYRRIIEASMEHPDRNYYLVVPEQYTMEAQRDLVARHPNGGILNIDAIGFNRMCYRIFDELNEPVESVLMDFGKSMLIKKVLDNHRDELMVYGRCAGKIGFVDEMKSMMSELFQYGITRDQVAQVMEGLDPEAVLYKKLADLLCVYDGFTEETGRAYIVAEQLIEKLIPVVSGSRIMRNSTLYFDGFTGFTPVQMKLIGELMGICPDMTFSFTMDPDDISLAAIKPYELFYLSKQSVKDITHMAMDAACEILPPVLMRTDSANRFSDNPELAHLESQIFRFPYKKYKGSLHNIEMWASSDLNNEIRFVADKISELVKSGRYRYRDIAVVAGDLETAVHGYSKIMEEYGIPVYIDTNTVLGANPFTETIRSVISLYSENFSYDSVMRYLKAGMTGIDNNSIEYLENYIIKRNVRGYAAWNREIPEKYEKYPFVSLEGCRQEFMATLVDITNCFKKRNVTVKDYVDGLRAFVKYIHMEDKLELRCKELTGSGRLSEAEVYGQVYEKLENLFDKIDELIGTEKMKIKEFYDIVDVGLSELEIGTVPPTTDRVVIGDITRSRLNHIKVLFLTGANEGIIPKAAKKGRILSDTDRETLEAKSIKLAPSEKINAFVEQFYIYLAITKPSDRLYLSYRKVSESLKAMKPSYLITRITNLFEDIKINEYDPMERRPGNIGAALRYVTGNIWNRDKQVLNNTYARILREQGFDTYINAMLKGARYVNTEKPLSNGTVKLLYGEQLKQSVSRLETFAECNFKYFLRYGLGLNERDTYEVDSRNVGTILHSVMEKVFYNVKDHHNNDWNTIDDELRDDLVKKALAEAAESVSGSFFRDVARNEYMYHMLERISLRTMKVLQRQIKLGSMKPVMIEETFNSDRIKDSGYNYILENGMKMSLTGKIDRADMVLEDGIVYVKLVDYKSSSMDVKFDEIIQARKLQLIAYSGIVRELVRANYRDHDVDMAGILYYAFDDPIIDGSLDDEDHEEAVMNSLKMKGFVHSSTDVIKLLDRTMTTAVPVSLKTDGIKNTESTLTREQIDNLIETTRENIGAIGNMMVRGDISNSPLNKSNACDYCPGRNVCRFDVKYGGNSVKYSVFEEGGAAHEVDKGTE